MPFRAGYSVVEPRFGATDSLAVLIQQQQQQRSAADASAVLSFELWSDAPETWFNGVECDEQFRVGVGALLLPQGRASEVTPLKLAQVCGHNNCVTVRTAAEGRRCSFVVFRRGPITRRQPDSKDNNSNSAASSKRELLIVKFEADAADAAGADQHFERLLDSVMVRQ
jgi:hypothetical protein